MLDVPAGEEGQLANTARGAAHFLRETVGRVRYRRGVNGSTHATEPTAWSLHSSACVSVHASKESDVQASPSGIRLA